MKYILRNKTPIPCDDEDLWNAWFTEKKTLIGEYKTPAIAVKAEFIGEPFKGILNENTYQKELSLFQVTAIYSDLSIPAEFSYYSTWEDTENKFNTYIPRQRTPLFPRLKWKRRPKEIYS